MDINGYRPETRHTDSIWRHEFVHLIDHADSDGAVAFSDTNAFTRARTMDKNRGSKTTDRADCEKRVIPREDYRVLVDTIGDNRLGKFIDSA